LAYDMTNISDTAAADTASPGSRPDADPSAPPRDFLLMLPPGWVRIPIDGREGARATALATAKVSSLPEPQRSAVRERLVQLIKVGLRQARQAGGVDVLMSLTEWDGTPIAASCLVSYVDQGTPVPLDMLADDLSAAGGNASLVEIAGRPAVRHLHADPPITRLDYMMTMRGKPGLLTFAFSTPMEPLAESLVVLFDAMMETLRWVK
jgi:hypothetical protein